MKYYPKAKIQSGLYTQGKEWMASTTKEEYIGSYFLVPAGAFTGPDPITGPAVPLTPYIDYENIKDYSTSRNFEYDQLKKSTNVKGIQPPRGYYPQPTDNDYEKGILVRYFARKQNDPFGNIIELSKKGITAMSTRSIKNYYYAIQLKWKISGPKWDKIGDKGQIVDPGVIDTNRRTLFYKERLMPGLMYKLQNLLQFSIYSGFANINDYTTEDQGFVGQ